MTDELTVRLICGLTRALQALAEAAPTILFGLLTAGVLRRMVGAEGTRRLFGGKGGWRALVRAWALGMLLPVCSFGVLPVGREMVRVGVPAGTVLAFLLAAPLLNPLSLLYGLTLSDPLVIVCFGIGSLVISTVAGAAWQRLVGPRRAPEPEPDEPLPPAGLKRMAAVALAAGRELTGPFLGYLAVGLLGVALMGALLPAGCLQHSMSHAHAPILSPLLMAAVATPAFASPMRLMMMLGLMFEHGNSVGAAFVLFILGGGLSLAPLAWVARSYGTGRMLAWLGILLAVVLALAYASERPLYFARVEEGHTHAFDDFTAPVAFNSGVEPAWQVARVKLRDSFGALEMSAVAVLLVLAAAGLALRLAGGRVEGWLLVGRPDLGRALPWWNRPLPGPVLGLVALAGLVVFGVLGAYIYYPDPKTAFDEMVRVRTDAEYAVRHGNPEEAVRQLERWDHLSRKLQVGVVLRHGRVEKEAEDRTETLRETLEEVRDALLEGRPDEARKLLPALEEAYRDCRASYDRYL